MLKSIKLLKAVAEFIATVADHLEPLVHAFGKLMDTIKDKTDEVKK